MICWFNSIQCWHVHPSSVFVTFYIGTCVVFWIICLYYTLEHGEWHFQFARERSEAAGSCRFSRLKEQYSRRTSVRKFPSVESRTQSARPTHDALYLSTESWSDSIYTPASTQHRAESDYWAGSIFLHVTSQPWAASQGSASPSGISFRNWTNCA